MLRESIYSSWYQIPPTTKSDIFNHPFGDCFFFQITCTHAVTDVNAVVALLVHSLYLPLSANSLMHVDENMLRQEKLTADWN